MSDYFFFFNDTATTEIYTLSLHDALPICWPVLTSVTANLTVLDIISLYLVQDLFLLIEPSSFKSSLATAVWPSSDRKSTRLNSSHANISYAVFCLKKKKKKLLLYHVSNTY